MCSKHIGVVIPAAGSGSRAGRGEPKQFRAVGGVPLLLRAIRPFATHPDIAEIVVVMPAAYTTHPPDWIESLLGDGLRITPGGETRADSVACGVAALPPECDYVLVHDAARPFVTRDLIDDIIGSLSLTVGVIAAVPVGDTLKSVDPERMRVTATVDRRDLWRAQTPQGFPREALERAIKTHRGAISGTDEASFAEAAGIEVKVVQGSGLNLKVTTPEDFIAAEAVAREWNEHS